MPINDPDKNNVSPKFYAHTTNGPPETWEPLETHLHDVAQRAREFAEVFGSGAWGELAGWWHDLGKYRPEFQQYLLNTLNADVNQSEVTGKVDHSTPGAQHAVSAFKLGGRLFAYIIAGHHSGLLDANAEDGGASLSARLNKIIPPFDPPKKITDQLLPAPPKLNLSKDKNTWPFQFAFFCRMLFSSLVDADFLETERFMNPMQSGQRFQENPPLLAFCNQLDQTLTHKCATAKPSAINTIRHGILNQCTNAAKMQPGFFSLTVPTGGGKTLSSLAFALHHAAHSAPQFRRVIYAIPFTSIIEQNARVFRHALGPLGKFVLEHHGNIDDNRRTDRDRLAAENWDAPIVVTTNVQLFESLFANRTSRCRKLHRIAGSIIILDEAQTLPTELIHPTLLALRELVTNYGCTVVLCTATQPAIQYRDDFRIGLEGIREIAGSPTEVATLFNQLRRVSTENAGKLDDETLAQCLLAEPQVLCIVNSRAHAAELFARLSASSPADCFHLSTRMCARHRSVILWQIRRRLRAGFPCRLISTSLIEAGVDIDFPVVYRAMTGLDSIIQAAGRCNREARPEQGRAIIFETQQRMMSEIAQAAAYTREVLPDHPDVLNPAASDQYFRLRLWKRKDEWDKHKICDLFQLSAAGEQFQFATAAQKYKLINDYQIPVIVPYDRRARQLIAPLLKMQFPPSKSFERKLQRYIVSIHPQIAQQLADAGHLLTVHDRFRVLLDKSIQGGFKTYDLNLGILSPEKINVDIDVWVS